LKRPLPMLAAAGVFGVWLGITLEPQILIRISAVLLIAIMIKRFNAKSLLVTISVLLFCVGLIRGAYVKDSGFNPYLAFENTKVTILGEVVSIAPQYATVKCFGILKEDVLHKAQSKVLINTTKINQDFNFRDIIAVDGIIRLYEQMPYWGETGSRGFYASKGIFASLTADKAELIEENHIRADFLLWGSNARQHIKNTIDKYLPGDEGALIKGILIGDKQDFSTDLSNAFRLSGLSHIVAVSGLHIGIFIMFISFGTSLFSSRKLQAFIMLLMIFIYVVIADFQPSILRAAVMAAYGLAIELSKLRKDSLCALMGATLLLSFINPFLICNIGFILSFLATLGIVLLGGAFTKYKLANAGIAAFLFTAPIIAYSFNTITLAALFTSILISPLVVMALLLGLLMCALPPLGVLISPVLFCISHVMIIISKVFASIKFLTIDVPSPSLLVMMFSFAGLYLLYLLLVKKGSKLKFAVIATFMLLFIIAGSVGYAVAYKNAEITFIATKYSNGVYIKSPNCYNIIAAESGWYDIANFLCKKNIKKLDTVILTSDKNISALNYLTDKVKVSSIYAPLGVSLSLPNTEVLFYNKAQTISKDGINLELLYADNGCANLKIASLSSTAIFAENRYSSNRLDADIVFIASDLQKNAVNANYAVLGMQYKREFLPAQATDGAEILRICDLGSITFRINEKGIAAVKKTRMPFY